MVESDLATRFGPLFEHAPRFLRRLEAAGPFADDDAMLARALDIALAMPEEEQVELIDAHPRLGAPPGSVSPMSFLEQAYDRDAADEAAESERARIDAELARLNDAYEGRFGFRYCVFVAGRPRAALLPGMRAALEADRSDELRRALTDIVSIARDRLSKLRAEGERG